MKVNKKVSIQGEWAKAKVDIHDGDLIKILDEGKTVAGDFGDRSVFNVETKNGKKLLSFNQSTVNYLIDTFGDDTEKWIGKEVKVWITMSMIGEKMRNVVYLTSPDWVETEDGFGSPTKDKVPIINQDDIPVIEEDADEHGNPL